MPKTARTLTMLLAACAGCATAHPTDGASSEAADTVTLCTPPGFAITSALALDSSAVLAGTTVHGTVTYTNGTTAAVTVAAGVIAARPPGGTHGGGPYDDFAPYAPMVTVAPGQSYTVAASRSFAASDPAGAWDVYPTYEDGDGVWHDGPDSTLTVGATSPGDAGSVDAGSGDPGDAGSAGGPPPVSSPLTGAVDTGSWQAGTINGMSYQLLLPSGYSTKSAYPLVLYLHQLDNASQIPAQIDPWFNDTDYRTRYPSIVVAPQCDMDADPSGNTINWGGVSDGDQPCQDNAIALVQQTMSSYSVYAPKVYVTGNSMGGIGSWDLIIKYNSKSPTVSPLFAATLILAGATYDHGYPAPDSSVVSALATVPIWAIHGGQDDQVPLDWDRNLFAAEQAQGGRMQLLVDPDLAHDVWDTYYVSPTSRTYWDWLFAQTF